MKAITRLVLPALAAAALLACGDDTPSGPPTPAREALTGSWTCVAARVFYAVPRENPPQQWRVGSCQGYVAITTPSRADSMETQDFSISANNTVSHFDFPPGTLTYDQPTGRVTVTYPDRVDTYIAVPGGLTQIINGLDLTGDGLLDSLQLGFVRTSDSGPR